MTDLKTQLQDDIKGCMRNKDKAQLAVLRLVSAEIKQREVDEQTTLNDEAVLAVLNKMQKQRRDALQQFTDAGRDDLAQQEQFELDVLQKYMPEPLSEDEVKQIINDAIAAEGASSIKEMGKVMAAVKPMLQGRCDLGQASQQIKALLSA